MNIVRKKICWSLLGLKGLRTSMKNFFFYQARKDSLSESKDVEEEVRSLMESKSFIFSDLS